MIQAAVDLAGGAKESPPPELRLYWMCQRYGALPDTGAMLDQDAGLIARMSFLGNVYDTAQRVRGLTGENIHQMRPDDGRLLAWLEEMGIRT